MKPKLLLFKILVLMLCALLAIALISCSEREERNYEGPTGGIPDHTSEREIEVMHISEAQQHIRTAMTHMERITTSDNEWMNIEFGITYKFNNYSVVPSRHIDYAINVKANINLKDNMKSQGFIQVKDVFHGEIVLGLYYFEGVLYIDVQGERYYMKELNLSYLGRTIGELLLEYDLDLPVMAARFLAGDPYFGNFDGVQEVIDILKLAMGYMLFHNGKSTIEYSQDRETQYISHALQINQLLGYLKTKIFIPGVIDMDISWEGFGLPNLDPLLKALLGFDLATLKAKDWPEMSANLFAINQLQDIELADGTSRKEYVFSGMGFSLDCPEIDNGWDIDLRITPMRLTASNENSVPISFVGLNLGAAGEDTIYEKGSIGNLELNTALYINNGANAELTLRQVLGDALDLGAVGDIPLQFKEASEYRFDVNVKLALDMFNNRNSKAEFLITFNGEQFIRGYLIGNPDIIDENMPVDNILYLDLSALKAKEGENIYEIIPNISISGFDIRGQLFESLLGDFLSFFDPFFNDFESPEQAAQYADEEEGGLAIGDLLSIVTKNLITDGSKLTLDLDSESLNQLLGMLLGMELNLAGARLNLDLNNLLSSIKLDMDITEDISFGFQLGGKNYQGEDKPGIKFFTQPEFDFSAIDTPAKRSYFTDVRNISYYNIKLTGEVDLGTNATYPEGEGIDFSGILGGIVQNVFLNFGIQDTLNLKIRYELNTNLNIVNFSDIELALIFYLPEEDEYEEEKFLTLYYVGAEDILYIDLESLHLLKRKIPMLSVVSELPKLKLENVGIRNIFSNMDATNRAEYYTSDGEQIRLEAEDSMDMMWLIGSMISGIVIGRENQEDPAEAIQILVNSQLLTVLLQFMGMDMTAPEVSGSIKLKLYKAMGDYLQIHLGILDSGEKEIEAIYFDLNFIKNIRVQIGRGTPVPGHRAEEYMNIMHWAETLVLAVSTEGYFTLEADGDEVYENTYLNSIFDRLYAGDDISGFMPQLLKSLAIRFHLGGFSLDVGYSIKGNISISNFFQSDLAIVFYDRSTVVTQGGHLTDAYGEETMYEIFIALYLVDNQAYVDLSYFGLPRLALTDVEGTLHEIYAKQWDENYKNAMALKKQIMDEVLQDIMQNTDKTKAYEWDFHYSLVHDSAERSYLTDMYDSFEKMLVQRLKDLNLNQDYQPTQAEMLVIAERAKAMAWDELCKDDQRKKAIFWDNYYRAINEEIENIVQEINYLDSIINNENTPAEERIAATQLKNQMQSRYQDLYNEREAAEVAYDYIQGIYPDDTVIFYKSQAWERHRTNIGVLYNHVTGQTIIDTATGKPRMDVRRADNHIKYMSRDAYNKRYSDDAATWRDVYQNANSQTKSLMDNAYNTVYDEVVTHIVTILPQSAVDSVRERLRIQFRQIYPDDSDEEIESRVENALENALREEAEHRIGNYYENDEILMMAWYVYQSGGSLSNLAPQTNQEIAKIMMAAEDRVLNAVGDPAAVALQMWFGGQRLSIDISSEVMNNLMGILGVNLPLSIRDSYLRIMLDENPSITLGTGADVLMFSLFIGNFSLGVNEEDLHDIEVPNIELYQDGTTNGVPEAIYVKVEGSLFFNNDPVYENENLINFTPFLQELLTVSSFVKEELRDFIDELEESGNYNDTVKLKEAAWNELYAIASTSQTMEMDTVMARVIAEIEKNNENLTEAQRKERAWDALLAGASMFDLERMGVDMLLLFKGESNVSLDFKVEGYLVFADLLSSHFSIELTLNKGDGSEPQLVLLAVYDGMDVYLHTDLFDIGKVKIENVENIVTYWREVFSDLFGADEEEPFSSPQNASSSALYAVDDIITYIDFMFYDGGIAVALAKAALTNVIGFLGIDITPYFEDIDFGANVNLNLTPVEIVLEAYLNILEQRDNYGNLVYERGDKEDYDVHAGLRLGGIDIGFVNKIQTPDPEEYASIDQFERISVSFGGKLDLLLEAPSEGYEFDYLVNMFTNFWLNRNPNIGLLFNIIDNMYALDIYFDLTANINLLTVADFTNIELYFNLTSAEAMEEYNSEINTLNRTRMASFTASDIPLQEAWNAYYDYVVRNNLLSEKQRLDEIYNRVLTENNYAPGDLNLLREAWQTAYGEVGDYILGDILSLYLVIDGEGKADAYLDLQILGIEPLVIRDAINLISGFTGGAQNIGGGKEQAQPAPLNAAWYASALYASQVLINISTDETIASSPILVELTAGAIYGIIGALGFDLEAFLAEGGYHPNIELGLFGDNHLLNIELILEKILGFNFRIDVPSIDITNPRPRVIDESKYFDIDEDWTTIKLAIEGGIDFYADSTSEETDISMGDLLEDLLQNNNLGFDIIIRTLEDIDENITFRLQAVVNIRKILLGDISGLEVMLEAVNSQGDVLLGLYVIREYNQLGETVTNAYVDASSLNVGKLKVENVINEVSDLFSSGAVLSQANNVSIDEFSAIAAIKTQAWYGEPMNAAGEPQTKEYVRAVLGESQGFVMTITAGVVTLFLESLFNDETSIMSRAWEAMIRDDLETERAEELSAAMFELARMDRYLEEARELNEDNDVLRAYEEFWRQSSPAQQAELNQRVAQAISQDPTLTETQAKVIVWNNIYKKLLNDINRLTSDVTKGDVESRSSDEISLILNMDIKSVAWNQWAEDAVFARDQMQRIISDINELYPADSNILNRSRAWAEYRNRYINHPEMLETLDNLFSSIKTNNPNFNDTEVRAEAWSQLYSQRLSDISELNNIYSEMRAKKDGFGLAESEIWDVYYDIWAWETLYQRANNDKRKKMLAFIDDIMPNYTSDQRAARSWKFYSQDIDTALENGFMEDGLRVGYIFRPDESGNWQKIKVTINEQIRLAQIYVDSYTELHNIIMATVNEHVFVEAALLNNDQLFRATLEVANFGLELALDKIEPGFRDLKLDLPESFNPDEYATIDHNISRIYVNLAIDFGWEMSEEAEYNFEALISSLLGDNEAYRGLGLNLIPILKILEEIGTFFRLEIEGNINITNIINSDLHLGLYSLEKYTDYDGNEVVEKNPDSIFSIYYINGDMFLDAESFNIQRAHLVNAMEYFENLFSGMGSTVNNSSPQMNSLRREY
ncbi:MAG: hypothetical protein ACOX2Y_06595 [Christensenellales bacterium]